MQPLRWFFLISLVTVFFPALLQNKTLLLKRLPLKTDERIGHKSKMPQFRWIILESVTGIWGRKAVQSMRRECHLPVALQTPTEPHSAHCHSTAATCYSWDSSSSHCRALMYIYCQAVSLAWFSLFRFLDCFGFVACFHCLGFFFKFCFQEITNFSKFLKARAGDAIPARCLAFNLNPHGHSTLNTLCCHFTFWRSTTAEKHEEGQCHVTKRNNSQKYFFLLVEQDIPGQTNFSL